VNFRPNRRVAFRKASIWIVCSMVSFSACATSSSSSAFKNRKIDRSYIAPRGITELRLSGTLGYTKGSDSYDLLQSNPLLFTWSHSVSDRFSFTWFVLPLGFRYQLYRSENQQIGFEFFNHVEPPETPALSEYLNLWHQLKLSEDWAIESQLGLQVRPLFKLQTIEYAYMLQSGARWQLLENVSFYYWLAANQELFNSQLSASAVSGFSTSASILRNFELEGQILFTLAGHRTSGSFGPNALLTLYYRW